MADIVDDAQDAIEAAEALRRALAKPFQPIRTGFCIMCEEPTEFTFCSPECRDDHEKHERIKSISGRVE
jgi:hypothetical protein